MQYVCPICGENVVNPRESAGGQGGCEYFPFCSDRCRLIDLGAWLDAEYRVPCTDEPEDIGFDGD